MKILCVFGQHNYGDPARGEGYEYSNFLPALRNLGHEVQLFDSFNRTIYSDFIALNKALLNAVQNFRPDVVFCVLMGYEIWLETLALIRATGVHLVNWGTDDSWKYDQFSRFVAPAFDLWATTSHEAIQKGHRHGLRNMVLTQWAASSSRMAEPLAANECCYSVTFIGSAYGNRPRWVEALKLRGIEVACFGHGWPNGSIVSEEIPRIVRASVVSLNFGDSGLQFRNLRFHRSRQIKARIFEVPGAGGCLLTENAEYLEDYFVPDQEILVFNQIDQLIKKIDLLVSHPEQRDAIAWAGYHRTLCEHTYEARFEKLLNSLPKTELPTPIDFSAFENSANRHRLSKIGRIFRAICISLFVLIWGRQRGPRAARRFVYELSWRILRKHTYTSAGLPGRWFYYES